MSSFQYKVPSILCPDTSTSRSDESVINITFYIELHLFCLPPIDNMS